MIRNSWRTHLPQRLALPAALLLCIAPALAWAPPGHRIVGDLAQRQLTPAARAQVADLLRDEPEAGLAGVAIWADTLRQSDPDRFKRTARWHYVNFPRGGCDYVAPRDCRGGDCAIAALRTQQLVLADQRQSRQSRMEALKFLVHFVGDVHQPMHAGYADDRGGNTYQISLTTGIQPEAYARDKYIDGVQGTNLHAVWDYYVLAAGNPDPRRYADALAARSGPGVGTGPTLSDPVGWVLESCRLLREPSVYPDTRKLDSAYLERMRPTAERRLLQAGHRLAGLLNAALAAPPVSTKLPTR